MKERSSYRAGSRSALEKKRKSGKAKKNCSPAIVSRSESVFSTHFAAKQRENRRLGEKERDREKEKTTTRKKEERNSSEEASTQVRSTRRSKRLGKELLES